MSSEAPLACLALGLTLRPFQGRALEVIRERLASGDRQLHIVAPPGSGKTILGLALVLHRGLPAVVLSPTTTIAAQWVARFDEHVMDTGIGAAPPPSAWCGRDPWVEPAPPVLSLTYQSVSVKDRDDGGLHDNVHALFERLVALDVSTIVLDESHHLRNHWAEAITAFLERKPDAVLVALTATPPHDAPAKERARHVELVGEVDHEIALPALVRAGQLAPFQDLAYLVEPTEAEHRWLAAAHDRFATAWRRLDAPPEPLDSLRVWLDETLHALAESELDEPGAGDWAAVLRDDPDHGVALARVAGELSMTVPVALWTLDEMDDAPTLDDRATVLSAYLRDRVVPWLDEDAHPPEADAAAHHTAAGDLWHELHGALKPIGLTLTRRGVQRRSAAVDRLVGLSAAKYDGLAAILVAERAALTDDLRAVVVTDFERATHGRSAKVLADVLDPECGGAISVLRFIASHAVLHDLEAVMVTGRNLVCDEDAAPHVVAAARRTALENDLSFTVATERDGALVRVIGTGRDWRAATYTLLVTALFEAGVTRCLVGTRGMLGEGWDARSANVLVDLTSASAFVATNQLRGRCLRVDPDRPEKVADLWDVVAVAPAVARGFADWERLVRKHAHAYGLADDGAIERGVGHVHPTFAHLSPADLPTVLRAVNEEMIARADRRPAIRADWRIGDDYADEVVASVELKPAASELEIEPPAAIIAQRQTARRRAEDAFTKQEQGCSRRRAKALRRRERRTREIAQTYANRLERAGLSVESALVLVRESASSRRRRTAGALVALATGAALPLVIGTPLIVPFLVVAGLAVAISARRTRRRQIAGQVRAIADQRRAAEAKADNDLTEADRAAADDLAAARLTRDRILAGLTGTVAATDVAQLYGEVVLDALLRADRDDAATPQGDHAAASPRVSTRRRIDGTLAVSLEGATGDLARRHGVALHELVAPLANQRYVLLVEDPDLTATRVANGEAADVFVVPVPPSLSGTGKAARFFLAAWRAHIGPARLLYTRSGEGAELLARHARRRWSAMRGYRRDVWR